MDCAFLNQERYKNFADWSGSYIEKVEEIKNEFVVHQGNYVEENEAFVGFVDMYS